MQTDEVLRRLDDHQARILARIEASVALLPLGPIAAHAPLARARWEMVRLTREYQLFKHRAIFDPAIASRDENRASLARRLKAACIAAGERLKVHSARWSAVDVLVQWEAYCRAMRGISDASRMHLANERRQVNALLATPSRLSSPMVDGASSMIAVASASVPGR